MKETRTVRILGWMSMALLLAVSAGYSAWAADKGESKGVYASEIVDAGVFDAKGPVGEVDDLVIRRSGRVKKVVLEIEGVLEFGDKLVGLPFQRFDIQTDGTIFVNETRSALEKRSEFDYASRNLATGYYYKSLPYKGNYPYPPHGYFYTPFHPYGPAAPTYPYSRDERAFEWLYSPGRFLATAVLDRPVLNGMGKNLGELEDLIINTDGEVEKFVLLLDGFFEEDRYVAVDYEAIGFSAYGLILERSPKALKQMPPYSYED